MSKILCIETATDICSVCLSIDGAPTCLSETAQGFSHASKLTLLIEECLNKASLTLNDIDAVAVSQGPGSYTGLRIGVSVAKGICYALDKPMIAIDTLEALAWACANEEKQDVHFCPMIDARRMEVYTAMYNLQGKEEQSVNALIVDEQAFEDIFSRAETIFFCGNGSEKCKPILTSPFAKFSNIICSAKHLSFLAKKYFDEEKFSDTAYFSPLYYKSPNITIPRKIL